MIKNKLIIFDYDGVIADSMPLWIKAFETGGIMHNISFRLDKNTVDAVDYIAMDEFIKIAGLENDERKPAYISDVTNAFKKIHDTEKFFKGISKLVENLHLAGNIICINTLNDIDIVRKKLEHENMLPFVSDISASNMKGSKAEKNMAFMEKYSFSPKDAFMAGDSAGDIIEGKKSGVVTVAVSYGWQSEKKLLSQKPDYMCGSVAELENFFKQL